MADTLQSSALGATCVAWNLVDATTTFVGMTLSG